MTAGSSRRRATTLEDAIAFYDSSVFRQSEEGQRLQLQDSGGQEMAVDVDVLAAFLRIINVLDNIRSTTDYLTRAKAVETVAGAQRLLQLADADINDALEVLAEGELHQEDAVPLLEHSKELVSSAADAESVAERDILIDEAVTEAEIGRSLMVASSSDADTTKPTVAIVSPTDGSTVSGTVTISADAADDGGISSVVFNIGQTQIGQDAAAPYEAVWDTTAFNDGFNQISVTAVDSSGNSQSASA